MHVRTRKNLLSCRGAAALGCLFCSGFFPTILSKNRFFFTTSAKTFACWCTVPFALGCLCLLMHGSVFMCHWQGIQQEIFYSPQSDNVVAKSAQSDNVVTRGFYRAQSTMRYDSVTGFYYELANMPVCCNGRKIFLQLTNIVRIFWFMIHAITFSQDG
jgi:hypothetical protein